MASLGINELINMVITGWSNGLFVAYWHQAITWTWKFIPKYYLHLCSYFVETSILIKCICVFIQMIYQNGKVVVLIAIHLHWRLSRLTAINSSMDDKAVVCLIFVPPSLGTGGIMFSSCPYVRLKPNICSFNLYMGPVVHPTNHDHFWHVCLSVRTGFWAFPG